MKSADEERPERAQQGRNWLKLGALALASVPFAVKVAYLNNAWVTSPVDRINIGLYAAFQRFFRTSDAHQFAYANTSNAVSVLSVKIGDDVHEIHPATHCLRSGGWFVEADSLRRVELPGRESPLQVTEAVVTKGGARALVWIWYSTGELSVGSFLRFRQLYSRDGGWHGFQVMTSIGPGERSLESERKALAAFLASGS